MPTFISFDGNPAPMGGEILFLKTADALTLRAAVWRPTTPVRGSIALLNGRSEFIEKYFEVIQELLARGFVVASLDWRGQGLSEHLLPDHAKGHVARFSDYQLDLAAFFEQAMGPLCPKPWFALSHSMGGAILLEHLAQGETSFARAVFSAPMTEIYGLRAPGFLRWLARNLCRIGMRGFYVPGGKPDSIFTKPFADNPLTNDPARYARTAAVVEKEPLLLHGSPTISWIHETFQQIDKMKEPNFAQNIAIPTLFIPAGADTIIDSRVTERLAKNIKNSACLPIVSAKHEIMMEIDAVRALFWAAFDAFIPGASFPTTTSEIMEPAL